MLVRTLISALLAASLLVASPLVGSLLVAGCGAARPAAPATGEVRFRISPESARVYTDEHFIGTARVLDVRPAEFRVGPRRFTITADGYFPHDLTVDLAQGTTTVEISLRPIPP